MRKYGLKLDTVEPEHYMFGASLPMEILQDDGDWRDFLPDEEAQDLNGIEPYACVTFTILNCIEILIFRKYGIRVNFSDRFLAAISGTKEGGNSPHVVCEFLRKIGVVKQDVWPFDTSITSFEKFYAPIPKEIEDLANEFNQNWDFKHEHVPTDEKSITAALKCSPLLISVPAWFRNGNDRYYRPDGFVDNHATTLVYERIGDFRQAFDSYEHPYLKDIEWSVTPMQIKRFSIKKKDAVFVDKPEHNWLIELFLHIIGLFKNRV